MKVALWRNQIFYNRWKVQRVFYFANVLVKLNSFARLSDLEQADLYR